jgi:predicted SPOUT superfamily RNA methylase MTH1
MITVGTKFVFRQKSYSTEDIGEYTVDEIYKVSRINSVYGVDYIYLEDDRGEERYFSEIKNNFYIYQYFYTVAQLRDKQIDIILDGEED